MDIAGVFTPGGAETVQKHWTHPATVQREPRVFSGDVAAEIPGIGIAPVTSNMARRAALTCFR